MAGLKQEIARIRKRLLDHVKDEERLAVVKAPPGSGKTHLLLAAVELAHKRGQRVAVGTQTNSQADDICRRLARDHQDTPAVRFSSTGYDVPPFGPSISVATSFGQLPHGPAVVVATTAKYGFIREVPEPFDVLFVEEAWQMSWARFMLMQKIAGRFVLIGDPGQIPPTVTVDTSWWETTPRRPHDPAPQVILAEPHLDPLLLNLPATWRLPHDTAAAIESFYDFSFGAVAAPGSRRLLSAGTKKRHPLDRAIDLLAEGSVVGVTIPTPEEGPPMSYDSALAKVSAELAKRMLDRKARYQMNGHEGLLTATDLGMGATHRTMNSAFEQSLHDRHRGIVRVDTPERWQGLECKTMFVAHPLSGVLHPERIRPRNRTLVRHGITPSNRSRSRRPRSHLGHVERVYACSRASGRQARCNRARARTAFGLLGKVARWKQESVAL